MEPIEAEVTEPSKDVKAYEVWEVWKADYREWHRIAVWDKKETAEDEAQYHLHVRIVHISLPALKG